MNIVFRSMFSILLVGGLTACGTAYTHESYDTGYTNVDYERYLYRRATPGDYYRPYFYYVPYSDYYRY